MSSNSDFQQVPHLTTALTGPLQQIEKHFLSHQSQIEAWFRQQWRQTLPPLYCSVDLRNAGFKLAPVDTNLFPAGFNNLNPEFMPLCIQAMQSALEAYHPGCVRTLLIPENHTRNFYYLESLATLRDVILQAGYEVRIGSLLDDLAKPQEIKLSSGRSLHLEPIERNQARLGVAGYTACIVLLNHDLSGAIPEILQGIKQPIAPPLELGWSTRLKSNHFQFYRTVAGEFAKLISIDPWLINPYFDQCDNVNFMERLGEDDLVSKTDHLLQAIQKKYDEYNIKQRPFVVVKADSGTYGMGVMTVHEANELRAMNRKDRTKMSASKGNQAVSKVILQEGVYTFETWGQNSAVAEPVVYMIGQHVVGGFYRVHTERGINENLNAPGMHFEPLAFVKSCNIPNTNQNPNDCANRFYAYGVIARLALVAAAREKQAIEKKG